MGRAFEFRKARKLKRWGNMARTFTRIGKQIAIAVKAGGPDPDNNAALRAIIATARHENMPKDNIERAIKNACGKDQKDYKEMNYEGYGPHGIAIYVETLTDNTTRTVANVRSVFTKFGGTLGTSGSLDFIFTHKSMFTFAKKDDVDMDELILDLIDFGVEDEYDEEEKEEETMSAQMGKGGAADEELYSMLKDLRKKVAKKLDLPPFVIFQDPSLEDMAIQYPITIEEMQNISGVGAGKAKKFGEEFIRLIKAYVEEKDIIRPQDMVVKSVANKSGNKIFIIQSIDRKMDFEDIARAKNLDFEELLSDIEGIVNSGTRLDISYYLDQYMDQDKIEDIYLYFKEDAESDSLDAAIEELGSDYTEEEIRLVRIKFLCEIGN